jgi:hypothetical protein
LEVENLMMDISPLVSSAQMNAFMFSILATIVGVYVVAKIKNIATAEDMGKITREVQEIKNIYISETERLKAALQKRVQTHNLLINKQMQLASDLWNHMVDSQATAFEILKLVKLDWNVPGFGQRLDKLSEKWEFGLEELRKANELSLPFCPDETYEFVHKYYEGQTNLVKTIIKKVQECDEERRSHKVIMCELEKEWHDLKRLFYATAKGLSSAFETFDIKN